MDYAEAQAVLARLPRLEVKPGLARIDRLLDRLGHPERGVPAIHITGTNGKGSVTAMLAAVLRSAGYRVGRYTSPELIDPRDRIVVDGEWIPERDFARGVERIEPILSSTDDPPTAFEAVTAVAHAHFAERRAEVAVIEVGLGGRYDATNRAESVLSILTNVALDHVALLGPTVERIAWEKAGIAKPGVPFLYGPLAPSVEAVVRGECGAVGADPVPIGEIEVDRVGDDGRTMICRLERPGLPERLVLPLVGRVQIENLRLALRAIERLRERGYDLPSDAIERGLRSVEWPGRLEVVRIDPTVILDGAHNPSAARALASEIESRVPERSRRRLLLGVLADKDVAGIVDALVPAFDRVDICRSESPRALGVDALRAYVERRSPVGSWYDSVAAAIDRIVPAMRPSEVCVVAGSLTVVGEARRRLVDRG